MDLALHVFFARHFPWRVCFVVFVDICCCCSGGVVVFQDIASHVFCVWQYPSRVGFVTVVVVAISTEGALRRPMITIHRSHAHRALETTSHD